MDLYELLARPSLRGSPISIIVRPSAECDPAVVVRKAVDLLPHGGERCEVLLLLPAFPESVPARRAGHRIRILRRDDGESGASLCEAIASARHEVLLFVDESVSLSADELSAMLEHLEYADVVIGKRAGRRNWIRRVAEWPLRVLLGIPQADPLSPVKAFRKSAVEELVLETTGGSVDLEIVAKANFLVSLIDEVPISAARGGPTLWRAILASKAHWRAWLQPTLWRSSLRGAPADRKLSSPPISPVPAASPPDTVPRQHLGKSVSGWPRKDRLPRKRTPFHPR